MTERIKVEKLKSDTTKNGRILPEPHKTERVAVRIDKKTIVMMVPNRVTSENIERIKERLSGIPRGRYLGGNKVEVDMERVFAMLDDGLDRYEIARELGVSATTIVSRIKEHDITRIKQSLKRSKKPEKAEK